MSRTRSRRKLLVATLGLATVAYVTCANKTRGVRADTQIASGGAGGEAGAGGEGGVGGMDEHVVGNLPAPPEYPPGNLPAPPPVDNGGCRGCSM